MAMAKGKIPNTLVTYRRELKVRPLNFKLGCFIISVIAWHIQAYSRLELKTLFYWLKFANGTYQMPVFVTRVLYYKLFMTIIDSE
jgi:hypothetical protein